MNERMFLGYLRGDGRIGIRNHVVIVSTVSCANHVVEKIALKTGAIPIVHETGCMQLGSESDLTERSIFGVAMNPNVGAVLFVGLGCEQIPTSKLAKSVSGKPSRYLHIQECGGTSNTIRQGCEIAEELKNAIAGEVKRPFDISHLSISVKCGGSDYTTAIASNPAVGAAADLLIEAGGSVILTETPGFCGSEHILARRAVNRTVAEEIYQIVDFYRDEMKAHFGKSPKDGNPTPGNMAGGITTLVEKSYGTIMKGGHGPIQGVLPYGADSFAKKGLWIMDTPGYDVFSVSGPASGGCHICWFTTGRGSPIGNAVMPVIKITGNSKTYLHLLENMDMNAGEIITGESSLEEMGQKILDYTIRVASGELTKAEVLEHQEFSIPRLSATL
jgi:altronate dehydratase large subunit